ncbi:centromere protein W isoform X2 [Paramormyrops kingsleyae]|uniref:Centromere protein W n=1 Tax=Paramormyrops kingsleyae TaxID=1676925 RepID=A0A3B3Q7Z4_9TELE|nr:centromere protein W isoform X2 [Paramormyrops kingsleyae]
MLKKAPRRNLKSLTRKNVDICIRKNADLLVELSLLLFLRSLAEESRAKAFEEKTATIRACHFKAVSKSLLKKARG